MPEYVSNPIQTVAVGQNVQFTETAYPCKKGYVLHRDGSGIFKLRGISDSCYALYKISFGANIAVPAGQTLGEISLTLSADGEPINSSRAIVRPTSNEIYFNVYESVLVRVPKCCCVSVAVENTSAIPVNVQNANIIIERVS